MTARVGAEAWPTLGGSWSRFGRPGRPLQAPPSGARHISPLWNSLTPPTRLGSRFTARHGHRIPNVR